MGRNADRKHEGEGAVCGTRAEYESWDFKLLILNKTLERQEGCGHRGPVVEMSLGLPASHVRAPGFGGLFCF